MTGSDELRVLIAGGGTGGHLFPALAIGAGLQAKVPGTRIHYIGSKFGIEANVLSDRNLPHTLLPIRGFQRGIDLTSFGRNLLFPGRVIKSYFRAKSQLNDFIPAVVVGTGGYASGLPLLAAAKKGIATLIQEQNSYPGATTRNLANKVDRVCLAFKESEQHLPDSNSVVTGNPIRENIAGGDPGTGGEIFNLSPDGKTLFVFGGSQGSAVLNRVVSRLAKKLKDSDIQLLWQTGPAEYEKYRHFTSKTVQVLPFISDMAHAYALSNLVISRAGALTIAELTACGKPAIFVPLPSAAADHQTRNARSLESCGAAVVITESELTAASLMDKVFQLLDNVKILKSMGEKSRQQAKPQATENIVNLILELARN